jgi:hypothetical protein
LSALLGSMLVLCAACTTSLGASDAANIKTIALSGFSEPEYNVIGRADIYLYTRPAGYEEFSSLMARENLLLGAELKSTITQALGTVGYQIVGESDVNVADAVLDVTIEGWVASRSPAYRATPFRSQYRPEFRMRATLTDPRTILYLMSSIFMLSKSSTNHWAEELPCTPTPNTRSTA